MIIINICSRKRRKCKQRKEKTTTNTTMLFLTLLMYSLATAHISLSLRQNLIAFFDQDAIDGGLSILNDQGNPIVYSQIAVEVINVSPFEIPQSLQIVKFYIMMWP